MRLPLLVWTTAVAPSTTMKVWGPSQLFGFFLHTSILLPAGRAWSRIDASSTLVPDRWMSPKATRRFACFISVAVIADSTARSRSCCLEDGFLSAALTITPSTRSIGQSPSVPIVLSVANTASYKQCLSVVYFCSSDHIFWNVARRGAR